MRGLTLLCLGISLLATLAACATTRPEVSWNSPDAELVWPPPPSTPRIRFLRSVQPADFIDEGSGSKLFHWISGEKKRVFPMSAPYGIAADGNGRIWVADTKGGMVQIFDLASERVDYLASAGPTPLVSPLGVARDDEKGWLYVSDSVLAKVFVFDGKGQLLGTREPPGGFSRPAGLATDGQGNLYVVDVLKNKVDIFSRDGTYLNSLESGQAEEGGFNRPANVAVDASGRVYVTDSMNFRIEMFDPAGKSIGTIGQIGDVPGSFARPKGVAIDSGGNIYVADAAFDNIQIFDAAGRLLLYFGEPGKGAGQLSLPAGLCFDRHDRLYVVDAFNQRVQIFQYLPAVAAETR